jgi:dimethylhistidine N-methyltransferase
MREVNSVVIGERPRFRLIEAADARSRLDRFAEAVADGLTAERKSLPSHFFYDEAGSRLFEQICDLPEYYLTRSETEILNRYAGDILADAPDDLTLVELGSGSAVKTRLLIEELLQSHDRLVYTPIDISRSAIEDSAERLIRDFEHLEIVGVRADYHTGLSILKQRNQGSELILWLGSSIGNLHRRDATTFLAGAAETMSDEDRLLIGVDLRKDRTILEPAYDDSQGVTAQFNLNLLSRINDELDGRFDLDAFEHKAVYDEVEGRVEMYLVSTEKQTVRIGALSVEVVFSEGETIHTENSYKYSLEEIETVTTQAGLEINGQWFDSEKRFSLNRMKKR